MHDMVDQVFDQLMTPKEVAAVFRVDPKTVARWTIEGRLKAVRTPGGHRRYYRRDIQAALANGEGP